MVNETNSRRRKNGRRFAAGFTLVEVTLALGIVSISFISLIGLLPSGLNSLRDSMEQTVHAQIVQRVCGDLSVSDFSNLTDQTIWFDSDGQYLGKAASAPADAFYKVALSEAVPSLPGMTSESDLHDFSAYLKRIQIGIKRANLPDTTMTWYAAQVAAR